MSKVRIVYKPDNQVAVIHLVEKTRRPKETDAQMFARIQAKIPDLKDLPFDDVDKSEIPQTREKRHQWRGSKGNGIHIDASIKSELEIIQDQVINMTLEEKIDFMLEQNGYIKELLP